MLGIIHGRSPLVSGPSRGCRPLGLRRHPAGAPACDGRCQPPFTIVANVPGTKSEFNYNGYTNGALVITVPKGWTVTVHCNDDGAL